MARLYRLKNKGKPPRLRPRWRLRGICPMAQPPLLAVVQGEVLPRDPIRSHFRRPRLQSPFPSLIAVLLLAAACGKVGDPLPPIVPTPQAVDDLTVAQAGYTAVLAWTNPALYIDNNPATELSVVRVLQNGVEIAAVPAAAAGQQQSYPVNVANEVGEPLRFEIVIESGRGKPSAPSNPVSIQPVPVPGAPRDLRYVVDRFRIALDWQPPDLNPELAQVYIVQRSDRPGAPAVVTTTEFQDAEYDRGKEYTYTVTAARGSEPRVTGLPGISVDVLAVDKTPPATPSGLDMDRVGDTVVLRWTRNTEADLAGYRVYRSDRVEPTPVEIELLSETVSPGVSYQVSAMDVFGNESPRSAPVTAR